MKEMILLFNMDQIKVRKLATQLMMLKFKIKVIKEEEWNMPVGYLCGNLTIEECKNCETEEMDLPNDPMLIMAGVDGKRINQVITAIKKAGIGSIPYKAIVTETNQFWKPAKLLAELMEEHEAMKNNGTNIHER